MNECEKCWNKYNLWINWNTLVWELWEYSLCDYCSSVFDEEWYQNEFWINKKFRVLKDLEFIWKVWFHKWQILDKSDDWSPFNLEKLLNHNLIEVC